MNLKRLTTNDFNLLIAGANIYEKKLRDKDFLIIFKNKNNNEIDYIEVKCRKYNFMHLTGVLYKNNGNVNDIANFFYNLILSNRLNINHFTINKMVQLILN